MKTAELLSALCLCLVACNREPEPVPESFRDAYIEMRVVSELYGTKPEGGILRREILQKYGYTAETFKAEFERLQGDYRLWAGFQKSLLTELDSLTAKPVRFRIGNSPARDSTSRDST